MGVPGGRQGSGHPWNAQCDPLDPGCACNHSVPGYFGYRQVATDGDLTPLETEAGGAGNSIIVKSAPDAERGVNGIGTVHHLAHRVEKLEDSLKIKAKMENEFGLKVTRVLDRKYFQSIYFRIPGGVLFEVATVGPGFLVDESNEKLGTALKLPNWQEPNRERIEQNLLPYDRA